MLWGAAMALVHLISDWSNAAEDEAFDKEYFFEPKWYSRVLSGQKTLLIGRKGTGKSAIARHLTRASDKNVVAQSVPFETIDPSRFGFSGPEAFESETLVRICKYVILRTACEAYVDAGATPQSRAALERAIGHKLDDYLRQPIAERLRRLRIEAAGFGVEVGSDRALTSPSALLDQRTEALIDFAESQIFGTTVRVVFDSLDSGWIEACQDNVSARYVRKVGSLIAAAISVKNYFRERGRKVLPYVCTRSDIFSQIANAQISNWKEAHGEILSWDSDDLHRLMKHRILQTARSLEPGASEGRALDMLFRNQAGDLLDFDGRRRRIKFMNYILDFSIGRPRDIVVYLSKAATVAIRAGQDRIRKIDIQAAQSRYGYFLRDEIEGELGGEYPGVRRLLNGIRSLGQPTMTFAEFASITRERVDSTMSDGKLHVFADRLFELGVIGNSLPNGASNFITRDQDALFDELLPIRLHPCYAAALSLNAAE